MSEKEEAIPAKAGIVTIHPHDHPEILSLDAGLTRATSPM